MSTKAARCRRISQFSAGKSGSLQGRWARCASGLPLPEPLQVFLKAEVETGTGVCPLSGGREGVRLHKRPYQIRTARPKQQNRETRKRPSGLQLQKLRLLEKTHIDSGQKITSPDTKYPFHEEPRGEVGSYPYIWNSGARHAGMRQFKTVRTHNQSQPRNTIKEGGAHYHPPNKILLISGKSR